MELKKLRRGDGQRHAQAQTGKNAAILYCVTTRVAAWLMSSSHRAYKITFEIAILWIVCLACLLVATGPLVQNQFGHDSILFLDGAWKLLHSNIPNRDFYSPLGVFNYLVVALPMLLIGPSAHALSLASALVLILASAAAWIIARPRFSAPLSLVFTIFVGTVATAPHFLRLDHTQITYSCMYNRWCYAFLIVIFAALFMPLRAQDHSRCLRTGEGVVVGILFIILLFTKVSYAIAVTGLIGVVLCMGRLSAPWLVGCALGFIPALVVFSAIIRFALPEMIGDLQIAAAARLGGITGGLLWDILISLKWYYLALVIQILALKRISADRTVSIVAWAVPAMLLALAVNVFIIVTNSTDGHGVEAPLLASISFIFMQIVCRVWLHDIDTEPLKSLWATVTVVCCVVLVMHIWLIDMLSVAYSVRDSEAQTQTSTRFESASLAPLIVLNYGGRSPMPSTYVEKINDGLSLLRTNCPPGTRVQVLDFTNPFPFALGWPPATGSPVALKTGFDVSSSSYPKATRVFAGTDALMIPKLPQDPATTIVLFEIYKGYIVKHFTKIAENKNWVLGMRKGTSW